MSSTEYKTMRDEDDEGQTKRTPVKTCLVSSVVCFPHGVLFVPGISPGISM
jgi:hypothetical protein